METKSKYKYCNGCKKNLTLDSFHVNSCVGNKDGLSSWCRRCTADSTNRWRAGKKGNITFHNHIRTTAKRTRLNGNLRRYEMTHEEYLERSAKNCAICGGPPPSGKPYYFDHNHKNGKFRGLLCQACNSMLGFAKDNPELLNEAAWYIREHS
jgi:Recombination endonuclease VII